MFSTAGIAAEQDRELSVSGGVDSSVRGIEHGNRLLRGTRGHGLQRVQVDGRMDRDHRGRRGTCQHSVLGEHGAEDLVVVVHDEGDHRGSLGNGCRRVDDGGARAASRSRVVAETS